MVKRKRYSIKKQLILNKLFILFCNFLILFFIIFSLNYPITSSDMSNGSMIPLAFVPYDSVSLPKAGVDKIEENNLYLPVAGETKSTQLSPDVFTRKVTFVDNVDNSVEKTKQKSDSVKKDSSKSTQVLDPDTYIAKTRDSIQMTDEFISLCAMVHCEAGEGASVKSKVYVGQVAMNRLKDKNKWGYSNLTEVIYAPKQFSVVKTKKFNKMKDKMSSGEWDSYMKSSVMAAHLVYTGSSLYDIDDSVQFFYGDPNKRSWGNHKYCFTYGGNSFFM